MSATSDVLPLPEMGGEFSSARQHNGPTRRTLVAGAAWAVPVIALAVATPLAAASIEPPAFTIESNFGAGWYPTTANQTSSGALQYDAKTTMDKYFHVTGTEAGDVVSLISFKVLISTGWPTPTFTPLPGSNPSWSTLAATGATEVVNGVAYNVFTSIFTGQVVASGSTTVVPIDFFFRSSSVFHTGATYQTSRFATVTRGGATPSTTPVVLVRTVANLVNTNVTLAGAPTP